MFLGKGVLKICSKYTGEHLCRSAFSMKLQSNFIEIALRHGCSAVNLMHIFRIPFPKNTSACCFWLLSPEGLGFLHICYSQTHKDTVIHIFIKLQHLDYGRILSVLLNITVFKQRYLFYRIFMTFVFYLIVIFVKYN